VSLGADASQPTFWPHEWDCGPTASLYETNFLNYFPDTVVVAGNHHRDSGARGGDRRLKRPCTRVTRDAPWWRGDPARLHVHAIIMLLPLFLLATSSGLVKSMQGLALDRHIVIA